MLLFSFTYTQAFYVCHIYEEVARTSNVYYCILNPLA